MIGDVGRDCRHERGRSVGNHNAAATDVVRTLDLDAGLADVLASELLTRINSASGATTRHHAG